MRPRKKSNDVSSYGSVSFETGTVTPLIEHSLCEWKVVGLNPSQVIPKTLKMVLAALLFDAQP